MKKIYVPIFTLLICCVAAGSTLAQISFTNQVSNLTDPTHFSGVAVTINDLNNDGLDDIVILDFLH